ncbi:hypothetical protein [Arthrobacter celericrescens]|uniref:hypothetical protein n=1 Tax=Arthrobacter celericrescens TaxID=2320851 RepID=UPI0013C4279E|nr:hypothetical protein [Arthrobacter celericrescens]
MARLLGASANDPGMPSGAEPAGELSIDLAPGDYTVRSACAGVFGVELTIVEGEGAPLTVPYTCDSVLERFLRHAGGPVAIRVTPPTGKPAAAGVTVQPNADPRASELEDLQEWFQQQLQPELPGQSAGSANSNTAISSGSLSVTPGKYKLHFVCDGPSSAQLSVASWAGAEVLAPVRVRCNGEVFETSVTLATEGADLRMESGGGTEARYAFRLVPSL